MTPNLRVLVDYGIEGWKFTDGTFETVDKAVKFAFESNLCFKFIIVDVIEWEAQAKN